MKGVTFGIAYTLSRTLTTVSDDGTFTRLFNPQDDYAYANFTFKNTGLPGAGSQTIGSVGLVQ